MYYLYTALIYIFLASTVLADHSSMQGSQLFKKGPGEIYPAVGATLAAPVTSVVALLRIPEVTEDLQTTSAAVLGVMFDGLDGCLGAFTGVQIIVDGGDVYYNAVYLDTVNTIYSVYEQSWIGAGDVVKFALNVTENQHGLLALFEDSTEAPYQANFDYDAPLCSTYASWLIEEIPGLPLAKLSAVNLAIFAGLNDLPVDTRYALNFSTHGSTAFISEDGKNLTITVL